MTISLVRWILPLVASLGAGCASCELTVIGDDLTDVEAMYVVVGTDVATAAAENPETLVLREFHTFQAFAQVRPEQNADKSWRWLAPQVSQASGAVEIECDDAELTVALDEELVEFDKKSSAVVIGHFYAGQPWRVVATAGYDEIKNAKSRTVHVPRDTVVTSD